MECRAMKGIAEVLNKLLNRVDLTDICINGQSGIYIDQGEGMTPLSDTVNEEDLQHWVLTQLSSVGKSWDARNPFVDATIRPFHRIHVVFPPASSKGILVSIRRLPTQTESDASIRWKNRSLYSVLKTAITNGESIIISGATGSGKTTLATDLISEVDPQERIIALEDTKELAPRHQHFISLTSRPPNADGCGEITLRNLLRQTLRMRPDRVVLGECRGEEVLDLLQALNTGHRGALATLHANSPRDALRRLELLCFLASNGGLAPSTVKELIASGIQLVAQVERSGRERSISEVWRIEGKEADVILMRKIEGYGLMAMNCAKL